MIVDLVRAIGGGMFSLSSCLKKALHEKVLASVVVGGPLLPLNDCDLQYDRMEVLIAARSAGVLNLPDPFSVKFLQASMTLCESFPHMTANFSAFILYLRGLLVERRASFQLLQAATGHAYSVDILPSGPRSSCNIV